MTEQLFTPYQVAKRFKVTRVTVYRWIIEGKLESFKIGENRRITEAAIQKFIEDSKHELKGKAK